MQVISQIGEMKTLIRDLQRQGKSIGFVPTMGYLHEGHMTLFRKAKEKTDFVVGSIFVNPLQFGVGEDFAEYPRDLTRDLSLARAEGVGAIFTPTVAEMYPRGYATFIGVEQLTDKLCGKSRPGHFRGVTTVVAKLFNIVEPDIAYFGQKDAQQVIVLQKMVQDLNMNLRIEIVPTLREEDGLAMSSRNSYLGLEERKAAVILWKSLNMAKEKITGGERDAQVLKDRIKKLINSEPLAKIDYVEILSVPGLEETDVVKEKTLIALAVHIGKTRLIDNFLLEV